MNYAQRHLADDEDLIYATRQHWTELVTEFLLLALIWVVAGGLLWLLDFNHIAVYVLVAIAAILSIWLWLVPLLAWRGIVYIVTTKRISKRSGFLTRTDHTIPLSRVNDVSLKATLWERILREGTVNIQSASEHGMLTLKHVPAPERLKDVIYQAMDREGQGAQ